MEVRLLAGRSLRHIPRIPEKLVGAIVVPLVFVLLFAYVFGSARSRSIRPERMSVATPIDTPGSIPIIVWAKIPDTR